MPESIPGIIHGRTIELEADPGLADGQKVEITIRPSTGAEARSASLARTAGSLADDPEFDAAMAEVERNRRSARHREPAG